MPNCEAYTTVDFGHGPVGVRCTEIGEHDMHRCLVWWDIGGLARADGITEIPSLKRMDFSNVFDEPRQPGKTGPPQTRPRNLSDDGGDVRSIQEIFADGPRRNPPKA